MRFTLCLLAIASMTLVVSAQARPWKPTPQQLAQDYSTLVHNKGASGGTVRLSWLAAPGFSGNLPQLMQKHVVLTLTHTVPSPDGLANYEDAGGVQVTDLAGTALTEVPLNALPPTLVGLTAQLEATFRQSTTGNAKMKILAFEPGSVHPCQKGGLAVTYAGERYTYETPMPGCAQ